MKSNVHLLRDVLGKIDAVFLVLVGSITKALKEEGFNKIEDPSWKDEMVMSKLVNGRV